MVTLFMSLFTIQQRYKYYFSCCIFLYMCAFFLVRIDPSALFSLCASFRVRFFPIRLYTYALFSGALFSYVLFSSALFSYVLFSSALFSGHHHIYTCVTVNVLMFNSFTYTSHEVPYERLRICSTYK